jgi:hypothetical protein
MAVFNEIGIGRWNRFIQKITDIKGSPPARQLASEIVFQHPIFHGQENRYLESWDRFGVALTTGPIAAQQSGVRLTNPSGSNVIAVVEKAVISTGAALNTATTCNLEYGRVGASLSQAAVSIPMESRGRSASTCLASFNAAVLTTLNVIAQVSLNSQLAYDFIQDQIQEISLPPGTSVQIDQNTVNQSLAVTFWWRERFLEPAERA